MRIRRKASEAPIESQNSKAMIWRHSMCQVQESELTFVVSSILWAHTYSMDSNSTLEELFLSYSSLVVAKSPHFSRSQTATPRFSYTINLSRPHPHPRPPHRLLRSLPQRRPTEAGLFHIRSVPLQTSRSACPAFVTSIRDAVGKRALWVDWFVSVAVI